MSETFSATEEQSNTLLEEMEKTIPQKIAVCAAHLMLEDGSIVLDAGCADGIATAYFALANPTIQVIGLDYDAQFIAKAQEKYSHIPNVKFIQDDLRNFNLGDVKLDAIVNLSILHEPYSYTGYRKKTVEEIIEAELKNLKPNGVIINRDFVMPDNPNQMVYMALYTEDDSGSSAPENMSYSELLELYSKEAMAFDNKDPSGHIKGFLIEDHTARLCNFDLGLPKNWKIFYLPHHFAWEFIWRKEYRDRFQPEANEKYGFWTMNEHIQEPEKLGGRVLYAAHYENPWIYQNWYESKAALFDKNLKPLPLPPSNFISVIEKPNNENTINFREHRKSDMVPSYLQISSFKNKETRGKYDMISRPGGDVVDVFPYCLKGDELLVFAKNNFPRPIINTHPRLMTSNLDKKVWSGHITEPIAAANIKGSWQKAVLDVLSVRSGFSLNDLPSLKDINTAKIYYTAPAELNERVRSTYIEIQPSCKILQSTKTNFSGFSNDGSIQPYKAQNLLNAAQVGMLAEARLELNIYGLIENCGIEPKPWIGGNLNISEVESDCTTFISDLDNIAKSAKVFEVVNSSAGWLDVVRSEFHEIEIKNQRERVVSRQEREFVVPHNSVTQNITTNSITIFSLVKRKKTEKLLIGIQKIDSKNSQFPAVQEREEYSGLLTVPGFRLPSDIDHIQHVKDWLSKKLGVEKDRITKLGEGYFPSIGVMPNRIYPFVVSQISNKLSELCEYIEFDDLVKNINKIQDLHLLIGYYRIKHALNL